MTFKLNVDLDGRVDSQDPTKVDFDLVRLCGAHQAEDASPEFIGAMKKIARVNQKQNGDTKVDIKIPVRVDFSERNELSEDPMRDLTRVARAEQVIKQQWEECTQRDEMVPGFNCTFVLEPMSVELRGREEDLTTATTPAFADMIAQLLRDNVWLSDLQQLPLSVEDDGAENSHDLEARKTLGNALRCVFNSTRPSPDLMNMNYHLERTGPFHLGSIGINGTSTTTDSYVATLCSAMTLNQMSNHVSLQFSFVPRDPLKRATWYKWLAYGIFSRRARLNSALENLVLEIGTMMNSDVEALSAILNAEHPEELLCGGPRGQLDERDATLRAEAPIRWDFNDDGELRLPADTFSIPSAITGVRTFSDDGNSQWIDAIVPGFGRCQVARDDLTFDQSTGTEDKHTPGLTSLTIAFPGCGVQDTEGLPRFLSAIGSSLRSLTLWGTRMELDDNVIVQHCPNLDELSLSGGWIDVKLSFSEYRAKNQPLPPLPTIDWHDIAAVSTVLSDMDNPIAQCVRRLRVRLTWQWNGWEEVIEHYNPRGYDGDVKPLLQMLEANKSLEYFEIITPREYMQHIEGFLDKHLKPIPRVLSPLPLDSKIAFLSLFSPQAPLTEPEHKRVRKSTPAQRQLRELTHDAILSIFAFAAEPVVREVYFRARNHGLDHRRTVLQFN